MKYVIVSLVICIGIGFLLTASAEGQTESDISTIQLNHPTYARNLSAGRHDLVQIEGAAGFAYGYGVFTRGFVRCPRLKTTDIPISRIYAIVEKKFWLDVVGLDDKAFDLEHIIGPVLLTTQWMIVVSGGLSDIDAVVAKYGCNAPVTRQMIASAEKLTVELLSTDIGIDGVSRYRRPPSLAGLPEKTQQLYDQYHLCKVRTGQSDHLGSFGPCDEALFQFEVSQAKATGGPAPTKDPINYWRSIKGPIGQFKERAYGTDFIFYEAPTNFTPEIPDTRKFKLPLYLKMQFNEGKRDRIWKINLTRFGPAGVYGKNYMYYKGATREIVREDYGEVEKAGYDTVLECLYYRDGRTVNAIYYWFRTRPDAANPARLNSRMRNHPLLLVMDARVECPPVLSTETRRKKDMLLGRMR